VPQYIYAELEGGERGREKKNGLQVYSMLSTRCNTNSNKLSEGIRKGR
jgi:hypothetical protein